MSMLHRPVAMGTVATLLAAVALVGISSTAHAEESSLPGIELSVPAVDVTDTDANLASAAREVVAIVDGPDGPEVLKLRAQTQAEAAVLAAELDSRPEVTAETNRVFTTPTVDTTSRGPAKPAGSFDLTDAGGYRTSSVYALGAEPFGVDQWGLSAVHADGAWTVTRGGGVTVAVVDSGVDATHPDLAGRVLPQIDFVDDPWTGDPTGHGTHVAGIIAASLDGAGVAGLANEVNILPIRVMDATGSGDFLTIASGIVEAVDQGAKVINLSLGSAYSSDIIAAAVGYAVDSGVTVIAAGGNSYAEGNPVSYPAALPGVVAVSSVNRDG
ncbi:MAG TPA: S8 family serine peptidase, partial [Candidatus Limnocylindrales bacterium]|nr:S8 family serine peptidase [Candidatus Limnocylindrales bacterium]